MSLRDPLTIKKAILSVLKDGKPHSYAELEKKVNSNWQTIRNHCRELEVFDAIKIEEKQHHTRNNKPYSEISIKKEGLAMLKKLQEASI